MVNQFKRLFRGSNRGQLLLPSVLVAGISIFVVTTSYAQSAPLRSTGQFAAGVSVGGFFGQQIAVVGDVVAVSERNDDTFADNSGIVRVYDQNGNLLTSIGSPNPEVDGKFGFYMTAVGDDRLLISANKENAGAGRAYLFNIDGTLVKTLEAINDDFDHEFGGRALLANESSLFIGSWRERVDVDNQSVRTGVVYEYDHDGNLVSRIAHPRFDEDGVNCLGRSAVFVDLDQILVGDPCAGPDQVFDSGAAFLFDLKGELQTIFDNPRPASLDGFGSSVAVAADRILIGGSQIDDSESNASTGAAYIYETDGTLVTRVSDPEPRGGNWFGWNAGSMTLESGEEVFIVGSIFNSTRFSRAGKVFLVNRDGEILQSLESPTPGPGEQFGVSFTQFGNKLLIGEAQDGGGFPDGNGAVWVYEPADLGDFDLDGTVDAIDIDILCTDLANEGITDSWDITGDNVVDGDDLSRFLELADRMPGDTDFDGQVTFGDFLTLSSNFGDSDATTWSDGNFDCSGHVEFGDFLKLSGNFGKPPATQPVPEPHGFQWLLLFVFLSMRKPSLSTTRHS